MKRRSVLALAAGGPALAASWSAAAQRPNAIPEGKVLRVGLGARENNFDPAQTSDVVSAALQASLFDAPLRYDHLARPVAVVPNTAVAMPEVNADFTRFVFTIQPGILFADDPVFNGRPRELVAEDYVYAIKRRYDPATRSPTLFHFEGAGLLGLSELRREAIEARRPFDYDREVAGLRVLDRYRFEVRLARPAPRLLFVFANPTLTGAMAREVCEAAGEAIGERPVGTGPFRLVAWQRGTRIVYARNPGYRTLRYGSRATPDDAVGEAIAQQMQGREMPFLDGIVFSIIEEAQPRWLAFLNGQTDVAAVPPEFSTQAAPNGRLAPNLERRGISLQRVVAPTTFYTYFNMEHPVTGGYEPARVALRRALALAYDSQREIDLVWRGQGLRAQSVMPPGVSGFDAQLKSEMSDFNPARAKALLDLYGYVDRDGDGWREQPDGSPLLLEYTSETHQAARQQQGLWHKAMQAIGVRIVFRMGQWQENIKASRAGQLMMWGTGWSAAIPDGNYFMDVLYSGNKGQSNHCRFDLPAFDELARRQRVMPDGPERDAVIAQAMRLALAYMPMKVTRHPIDNFVTHAHVRGFKPHPFIRDWWRYVDLVPAA
jgi:ABC-type transport system substrate-binding protein